MSNGEGMLKVKILTLGESGVGKSSLLLRYRDDKFTGNFVTTLGVEYKQKQITIDEVPLLVQVWDTAGQERFKTITPNYYRSVDGAVLVFDITDLESFDKIESWIKDLQNDADISKIVMVLVGNKADLEDKRVVSTEAATQKAKQYDIEYIETSAKRSQNVDILFETVVRKAVEKKGGIQKFKALYNEQLASNVSLKKQNTANHENEKKKPNGSSSSGSGGSCC